MAYEYLYKKLVPISKIVSAAMMDSYAVAGRSKESFYHWCSRGIKKLQIETLKLNKRRVLLTVNHNTKTASLPLDCDEVSFVGYINDYGERVSVGNNTNLINEASITDIEPEECCSKCKQDKGVCNDLEVTEAAETVVLNGTNYTKTIVKKLYPNGDYFLETTMPYYNTVTEGIEYATTKEFIKHFDITDCGCIANTEKNLDALQSCAPDVYGCYFTPCSSVCHNNYGGYNIMYETGLLQLDDRFNKGKVYIEYYGFLPKVKGQYAVPQVAFETLVEWTKYKAIANKQNVNQGTIDRALLSYMRERDNMVKVLGRVSLAAIIHAANKTPVFEFEYTDVRTLCKKTSSPYVTQITSSTACKASNTSSSTSSSRQIAPFQLAVKVGQADGPVLNQYTYFNKELIGAFNLNHIIVNNGNETTTDENFTFDTETGIITRTNPWVEEATLVVAFAKYI